MQMSREPLLSHVAINQGSKARVGLLFEQKTIRTTPA